MSRRKGTPVPTQTKIQDGIHQNLNAKLVKILRLAKSAEHHMAHLYSAHGISDTNKSIAAGGLCKMQILNDELMAIMQAFIVVPDYSGNVVLFKKAGE